MVILHLIYKTCYYRSYQGLRSHKWSRTTRTHKRGAVCVYPAFCIVLRSLQHTLKRWLPSSLAKIQTQNQMQQPPVATPSATHAPIRSDTNTNCLSLEARFRTAVKGRQGVGRERTWWILVAGEDPEDRDLGTWGRATAATAQSSPQPAGEKGRPSVEDPAERNTAAPGERRVRRRRVRCHTTTSTA